MFSCRTIKQSRIDALVRVKSYKMLVSSYIVIIPKWATKKARHAHNGCHVNKSKNAKGQMLATNSIQSEMAFRLRSNVMGNKLKSMFLSFSLIHISCTLCHNSVHFFLFTFISTVTQPMRRTQTKTNQQQQKQNKHNKRLNFRQTFRFFSSHFMFSFVLFSL